MNKCVLGIDLGTSSVKALCRFTDGSVIEAAGAYSENSCEGFYDGVKKVIKTLAPHMEGLAGIGLSSQVGTYLIETNEKISIMPWNKNSDDTYLKRLLSAFKKEDFLEEITMPHPNILSYPLPKLMEIQECFQHVKRVFQPKDFLCERLTGNMASDIYSWRGLTNLKTGKYSEKLLNFTGFDSSKLPRLTGLSDCCGVLLPDLAKSLCLPENLPVFTGCNDFFASLIGMGIKNCGDAFDITGTSEHIGVISKNIDMETTLVSGGYFKHNVTYGVTASSGVAMDWGLRNFKADLGDLGEILEKNPPIFLPYMNGERAPIWDSDAGSVFFGINGNTEKAELKYSVFEGACFNLFHIRENIDHDIKKLVVSGGAARDEFLNMLKAEILNIPVITMTENNTSALGAAMLAGIGAGFHVGLSEAMESVCIKKREIIPTGKYSDLLSKRFSIYKKLYPLLKDEFKEFKK